MKHIKSESFRKLLKSSIDEVSEEDKIKTVELFKIKYLSYLLNPKERSKNYVQQILLRAAFLASSGKSLNWAYRLHKKKNHYKPMERNEELESLDKNGYLVLDEKLSTEKINQLREALKKQRYYSRRDKKEYTYSEIDNINKKDNAYWCDQESIKRIMDEKVVAEILANKKIINLVRGYLGSEPNLDFVHSWISFPGSIECEDASGQMYHYDLDRVKFIKIFIYLDDTTKENGAHCFIRGSHKTIGRFAYKNSRYTDAEVFSFYSKDDEIIHEASAGTIILEDTIGLHKGLPLLNSSRQILQFQFSINNFGYPHKSPIG